MKYKVGDRVRIKSLDWYNENKTIHGDIWFDNAVFVGGQSLYCGCELTIRLVTDDSYYVIENDYYWTDEMIEGLVEEKSSIDLTIKGDEVKECIEITIPEGYEYVIESGKIIFTKKKKGYPKTYEECCKVLGWNHRDYDRVGYKSDLLCKLQVLLLCRDAYWKLAGEEMGLDKPWEPGDNKVFGIIRQHGKIQKYNDFVGGSTILEFPTEEMRDAFYENFDPDIENCKELL